MNAITPSGLQMPDWEALGRGIAESLPDYQYTTALEALSAYAHEYSRAKLVEFLNGALLVDVAQPGSAHEAFCQLPFERVVTTNFDFLLEQAYSALSRYCLPLISEGQLAVGSVQAGVRLLKLHGDLHHPARLVVTEEDYDSFLSRYPLLATHLSSLLIENTAFFIGYSLDDPDFRQIWQVVKERLGRLRRPAYVIQIEAAPHITARYERRGVKVINLPRSHPRSYGDILEISFRELLEYWSGSLLALSTATESEPQAELSLPLEAKGRLCFFAVPTRHASFYKSTVYPIAERCGFSPIMAADVIAPGDNIMAKVFALIEKAAVVVADVSTPNTLHEAAMVLTKGAPDYKLIVVAEESTQIPIDLDRFHIIRRPRLLTEDYDTFLAALEKRFTDIAEQLAPDFKEEAQRLLTKKEYRAAVIAAFTMLEHELRQALGRKNVDVFAPKVTIGRMLLSAVNEQLISPSDKEIILDFMKTRNLLVHTKGEVSPKKAKMIVVQISRITELLHNTGY